jgi:hypothetical protein
VFTRGKRPSRPKLTGRNFEPNRSKRKHARPPIPLLEYIHDANALELLRAEFLAARGSRNQKMLARVRKSARYLLSRREFVWSDSQEMMLTEIRNESDRILGGEPR